MVMSISVEMSVIDFVVRGHIRIFTVTVDFTTLNWRLRISISSIESIIITTKIELCVSSSGKNSGSSERCNSKEFHSSSDFNNTKSRISSLLRGHD